MTVVRSYTFRGKPGDVIQIEMPEGAEVLHMQVYGLLPAMWVREDPDAPKQVRRFALVETGMEMDGTVGRYVGTISHLVSAWHVFEEAR